MQDADDLVPPLQRLCDITSMRSQRRNVLPGWFLIHSCILCRPCCIKIYAMTDQRHAHSDEEGDMCAPSSMMTTQRCDVSRRKPHAYVIAWRKWLQITST